jgi:hypothetical protein
MENLFPRQIVALAVAQKQGAITSTGGACVCDDVSWSKLSTETI